MLTNESASSLNLVNIECILVYNSVQSDFQCLKESISTGERYTRSYE